VKPNILHCPSTISLGFISFSPSYRTNEREPSLLDDFLFVKESKPLDLAKATGLTVRLDPKLGDAPHGTR
jgi:hypothetical protein